MSDANEVDELIARYLDQGLAPAEAERLASWLRQDPRHPLEFVRAVKLHRDLRYAVIARASRSESDAAAGGWRARSDRRPAGQARPRRFAPRWIAAAAAAAAVLAVSLGWWALPRRAAERIVVAEVAGIALGAGPAPTISRPGGEPAPLVAGARIASGDRIATAGAAVSVRCELEATRFELAAGTAASFAVDRGAMRVALDGGSLRVSVAKQAPGSTLTLRTPQALAEVIGTEFILAADGAVTSLEVTEGTVRFTRLREGTMSEVTAGARAWSDTPAVVASPYRRWTRGPSQDDGFFPIGVWMEEPSLAGRYREAGITMYVGLPAAAGADAAAQLDELRAAGMPVLREQDEAALSALDDRAIVGWLAPRRPDDAPSASDGDQAEKPDRISTIGTGAYTPVPPAAVVERYRANRDRDPTRPILLALGAGAAWDGWYGRGNRAGHPEDYPEYLRGCDIAGFGVDPLAQPPRGIAGRMELIGDGVDRLRAWGAEKPVWCFLSSALTPAGFKPSPGELRSAAWMALIHGAKGLVYVSDRPADPAARRATLLDDPAMATALAALNHRILALAPALNGPTLPGVGVVSSTAAAPVAALLKRAAGERFLFAIAMRPVATIATFTVSGLEDGAVVEVLDEDRRIAPRHGAFSDSFAGYGVHLYALHPAGSAPGR